MKGIDISHHNGIINWTKVVNSSFNPEFVFIKCTQGVNYLDPLFFKNAIDAKNIGLKVGYYHFSSLNDPDVIRDSTIEAKWFLDKVRKAPIFDMPLVLDIEENKLHLSKDKVLLWINNFFNVLTHEGFINYILYSYSPFLNENLPLNHNLNHIRLWIADYTPPLILPKGWNQAWIHQYSQSGKIQGINGNVDLNITLH